MKDEFQEKVNACRKSWSKTDKRKYKEQLKQCRKALGKIAKTYLPYGYDSVFEMMKVIFQHWSQYYELGYNVFGDDSEETPTRKEIANELSAKVNALCEDGEPEQLAEFVEYFKAHILRMWD